MYINDELTSSNSKTDKLFVMYACTAMFFCHFFFCIETPFVTPCLIFFLTFKSLKKETVFKRRKSISRGERGLGIC